MNAIFFQFVQTVLILSHVKIKKNIRNKDVTFGNAT